MKIRVVLITGAAVLVIGLALVRSARHTGAAPARHSILPAQNTARAVLNASHLHREWVNVPAGSGGVRAFLVHPERADKAPVVVVTDPDEPASEWVRAVGDRIAAEGYIAIVPDALSGEGPHEGDTNSFPDRDAMATALARLGRNEIARRINVVREYAVALPAANGKSASLELSSIGGSHCDAGGKHLRFDATSEAWPQTVAFLNRQTDNRPIAGANPYIPEDHSAHIAMAMAQAPAAQPGRGGRGYPMGKLPDLPAGIFNAKTTVTNSKLRKEFVDLPLGSTKLHLWVEYPEGDGKAPVVLVMQHGPGMDDWQRALADQLALQGFIAIAPDLHSGLGPNGGNYDSFQGTDDVMRAGARITPEEGMRRYKAAYEYGMKLPRANGKSATIGFCAGGGYSFRFAGEVPDINAAIVFYGTPPNEETMAKIKAPVLAFYGEDDARVTATVEPASAAMKKLGKTYEPHIYPHATHGFLEYQDLAGNPAAVSDSWSRTIAFLNERTK